MADGKHPPGFDKYMDNWQLTDEEVAAANKLLDRFFAQMMEVFGTRLVWSWQTCWARSWRTCWPSLRKLMACRSGCLSRPLSTIGYARGTASTTGHHCSSRWQEKTTNSRAPIEHHCPSRAAFDAIFLRAAHRFIEQRRAFHAASDAVGKALPLVLPHLLLTSRAIPRTSLPTKNIGHVSPNIRAELADWRRPCPDAAIRGL